jgi:phage-related protein
MEVINDIIDVVKGLFEHVVETLTTVKDLVFMIMDAISAAISGIKPAV